MTVEKTIGRANQQIAAGKLWRAKEILGSSIPTYGYSRELFESLGRVMQTLGDEMEAGKWFLLSVDKPDESQRDSIKLFLSRCGDQDYANTIGKFPSCARISDRNDYPKFLREHLAEIGAPEQLLDENQNTASTTLADSLLSFGCIVVVILFFVCAIVGAFNAILFVTHWLYSI